ncbi:MAG: hypothetical protein ACK5LL_12935 [Suipraeoptans sp.]
MYNNYPVDLVMKEMILEGGFFDEVTYSGIINKYDKDKEVLFINVREELPIYSRDAVYQCTIAAPDGNLISCEGVVEDRYWTKDKRMIVFRIQKGFNKNSEKSI